MRVDNEARSRALTGRANLANLEALKRDGSRPNFHHSVPDMAEIRAHGPMELEMAPVGSGQGYLFWTHKTMHTALYAFDTDVKEQNNCRTSYEYRFFLLGKRELLPAILPIGAPTLAPLEFKKNQAEVGHQAEDRVSSIKLKASTGLFPFTDREAVAIVVSKAKYDATIAALVATVDTKVAPTPNDRPLDPADNYAVRNAELDATHGCSTVAKEADDARTALVDALLALGVDHARVGNVAYSTRDLRISIDVNSVPGLQLKHNDEAYVFVVHKNNKVASAPYHLTVAVPVAVTHDLERHQRDVELAEVLEELERAKDDPKPPTTEELEEHADWLATEEQRSFETVTHGTATTSDGEDVVYEVRPPPTADLRVVSLCRSAAHSDRPMHACAVGREKTTGGVPQQRRLLRCQGDRGQHLLGGGRRCARTNFITLLAQS